MSLKGWEVLNCPCGNKDLVPVVNLKWQEGLGTTPAPNGYQCVKCKRPVDTAQLITDAKNRDLNRKIKELEEQRG